ncbi:MAG: hypothetical protein AB8W37_02915 [Arsenophonus endosymbiont of Dermacentor nuttalli]
MEVKILSRLPNFLALLLAGLFHFCRINLTDIALLGSLLAV